MTSLEARAGHCNEVTNSRDECAAPNDTRRQRGGRGRGSVASVCPLRACDNDSSQPAAAPARASFRPCWTMALTEGPRLEPLPNPLWRGGSIVACQKLPRPGQVELPMRDWIRLRVALSRAGRRLKAKGVKKAKCSFGAIYWQKWPKVSVSSVYLFIAATRGDCFIPLCLRLCHARD